MKESGSGRLMPSSQAIQIHEYEFVIYVKTCSILLKFPCRFALSWKLDRQTVDCPEKVEQINGKVVFNQQLKFRTTLTGNHNNLQPRKGTLFVNYFTMTKPNQPRLAGVVSLDLSKFTDGCEQKDYKLEKQLDKQSSLRFAVICSHIRQLDQITDPYSVSRYMQQNISEMSLRSHQSRQRLAESHQQPRADLSQFVTPKQHTDTPPSKMSQSIPFTPERTQPMLTSRQRQFQLEYDTPKLRQLSKTSQHNISHSRPPPSTPAADKEQATHLLAKFQSQRRLRQSLEAELNKARQQNQELKSKTDQISDKLFESESRVKRLAEMSRISQQSQIDILNKQNQQLKNQLSELISKYNDESALSIALQRDNQQLRQQYENEHSICSILKKQLESLTPSLGVSLAVSPQSNKAQITELDILRRKLISIEEQLQRQRMMPQKQQLLSRIRQLEEELERTEISGITEDEGLQHIINLFNAKYDEIVQTCGILEQQCMLLISALQQKEQKQHLQSPQMVTPFKQLKQHRDFQAATDDLKNQLNQSPVDSEQLNKMKMQNISLREETRELQNNLADSRRSLWDFKQLVFKYNERSRVVKKGERSARYRHHMRHYDRLKNEYIDKLRQMYEQIMHLNEVIYNHNAKQKQMALEVQEINEKYGFMEAASRQLRQRLQQCQQQHQQTIQALRSSNARLIADILKLKDTIYSQQQQIGSLRIQLQNMDNSDLLMNTEDMHTELEASHRQCQELRRKCNEMLMYIDELRTQCQHQKENIIFKDAEIDELRHQLKKRKMEDSQMAQSGVSLESSAVTALRDVAEVLKINTGTTKQEEAIKAGIQKLLETHKGLAQLDTADSRAQKLRMMDKMREVAIQFNRIKIDRMKALQGSSQLRKQFLRSVRPMQGKLDQLLNFSQGILNSKTSGFQRKTQ